MVTIKETPRTNALVKSSETDLLAITGYKKAVKLARELERELYEMNTSFERKAQKDEWLTPKFIINALAPFGLDPCASEIRPWSIATNHYTRKNNGLLKSWTDLPVPLVNHVKPFVWLNPPYGNQTQRWFRRMADHNHGIALTFARTETRMFFESVWPKASAVLFLKGRLSFCDTTGKAGGSAGAPSVLIAYGEEARQRLKDCKLEGKFIEL